MFSFKNSLIILNKPYQSCINTFMWATLIFISYSWIPSESQIEGQIKGNDLKS